MADQEADDEELKAAIAMSLSNPEQKDSPALQELKPLSGLLGMDRKAMEAERLARMHKKRPRSISPPPIRDARKAPKLETTSVDLAGGARLNVLSTAVQREGRSRKPAAAQAAIDRMKEQPATTPSHQTTSSSSSKSAWLQYPRGAIKKTWAFGHDRTGNDIKLEEVLEPLSVRTAVLSDYQWDTQWVLSKLKTPLNGGSTKCIFVMQAKDHKDRDQWREDASDMKHFLRLCFPNMSGLIFCMHSKLMLLFHANKLRIALPTANLLNFDWGETGQMENTVFLIDLPRLPAGEKTSLEDLTPFGKELMFFIEMQGLDQDVRDGVLNFDFSATAEMAFVHTVGGIHYKEQAARTGLLGLSRTIRQLNLATTTDLEIDFAASSIGALTDKQLIDFHMAARGVDLLAHAREARSKAGANFFQKTKGRASQAESSVRQKLRIYFPTKDTVRSSTAGAAGTICLQRDYYEKNSFPKECFRDHRSTRKGLLSHNKILCARGVRLATPSEGPSSSTMAAADPPRSKQVAWLYVGSSNMSKSAWGELPAERTEHKITCRNWECGVILPVPFDDLPVAEEKHKQHDDNGDSETESEDEEAVQHREPELVDIQCFKSVIDLPFSIPGEEYNSREPWYFKEQQ